MDQRRRRWADVVQMLYKCFVFAEELVHSKSVGIRQMKMNGVLGHRCAYIG